jgi:hypothetical protein
MVKIGPDPERNRRVHAQIFGQTLAAICPGEMGELPTSGDGWFCLHCGFSGTWSDPFEHAEQPPPYDTDLNRALTIFDKMADRGLVPLLKADGQRTYPGAVRWTVAIASRADVATLAEVPAAICEQALAALHAE